MLGVTLSVRPLLANPEMLLFKSVTNPSVFEVWGAQVSSTCWGAQVS